MSVLKNIAKSKVQLDLTQGIKAIAAREILQVFGGVTAYRETAPLSLMLLTSAANKLSKPMRTLKCYV